MTRGRHLAVLVVTVVVAAAGLPLGAVVVPGPGAGAGTGTVAAQTAPTAACEIDGERYPEPGENVTLDASNTTDAAFVEFDFDGDGNYEASDETDFRVTTTYEAGTYNATVRAKNSVGSDTADCGTLTVGENDPPSVGYDVATEPLKVGDEERFVADATDDDGSVFAYLWRVDGELVGETDTFEYTFPTAGEYTVNLTVYDNDGDAASVSKQLTVEANDPPTAALRANRSAVSVGDAVGFDAANATDSDGSIASYEWDFDGDDTVDRTTDGPTVIHRYESLPNGTVRPTVRVIDDDGASDTANVSLDRVNAAPTARFVFNRTGFVAPGGVLFDASASSDPDGSIASYEWDLDGDGAADGAGSIAITRYATPGNYTATLTVTDDEGAVATATATVVVENPNRPPVARIGANRTVVTRPSEGVAFAAANSTDPDGAVAAYRWDFDADGTTDATGARVVYAFARGNDRTTRRVRLTVVDADGATDTAAVLITVAAAPNRAPTAAFSVSPSLPVPGENVTLDALPSVDVDGSIASYEWDLDGDGTADANGPVVTRNVSTVADPTLVVTDDEGASDAVSRTIEVAEVTNGTGAVTGGVVGVDVAGRTDPVPSYINLPPRANVTVGYRISEFEPGDRVRVYSRSVDPDGRITAWTWYVNGAEIDPVSRYGTQSPKNFETTVEAGTNNVTLIVDDDDGATDRIVKTFVARERTDDDPTARFDIGLRGSDRSPGEITVGEPLVLDASGSSAVSGRTIGRYEWSIRALDGPGRTQATGREIFLGDFIDSPGRYRISLLVRDNSQDTGSTSRTITVRSPDSQPRITGVTAGTIGPTLEGAPVSKEFTVAVSSGDPIRSVELFMPFPEAPNLRSRTDRSGADGWSGTFDLSDLDRDATLSVVVTDEDGDTDATTRRVEVVETPAWVESMIAAGDVRVERTGPDPRKKRIVIARPIPDPPIDVQLSPPGDIPIISDISLGGLVIRSEAVLIYNMPRRSARFDGDGTFRVALLGNAAELGIVGDGRVAIGPNDDWRIQRLRVSAVYDPPGLSAGFGESWDWTVAGLTVEAKVTADISIQPRVVLTARLGDRGGDLRLTGGQIAAGLLGEGGASAYGKVTGWFGNSVSLGLGARIEQADLTGAIGFRTRPFGLRPALRFDGRVRFFATAFGYDIGTSFDFGFKFGSANIGYGQLSLESVEMRSVGNATIRPAPVRLGRPPGRGGDAATLGLDARAGAVGGADRLTTDRIHDGPPAVAYANGTYTAVWSRGDPDGAPGEFDVYAATSADGRNWSTPAPIVDDDRTVFRPDLAAAGERRAAVWTRALVPTNDTSMRDIRENSSIALAVDDGTGTGWAAPVTIEDGIESSPAVAAAGERFLIAWVRDADGNGSTTADREARWAIYRNGSLDTRRTIPNATDVAVAGGPNGFTLAYLASDDGQNGSVVRADLVGGRLVEAGRFRARNVTGLEAGPRAVVWTAFDGDGTALRYAGGDGIETVPTGGVLNAAGAELLVDAGRPLVVYRGQPLGGGTTALFASRRTTSGWLPPVRVADAEGANLSVTGAGAAVGEDALAAAVAVRNVSARGYADVFAVRRGFAPDLTIDARTGADLGNVSVGDRVRVNYTVRNVGARATTDAIVALETVGGTAAASTHGPLAPGDRATGTVTVEVGTGPTLRVDPEDALAEANESNNARSVALVRSDLTVGTLTRRGAGGAVVVEVGVRNRGPVPVANATVAVRVGNATLAQRRVDVPGAGRRLVRLRVQRDAVNRSQAQRIVVDPGDAVVERDERNNAAGLHLLAVDLGLSGAVATTDAPGGVLADTFVSNAGPVDAAAAVTVAGNGTTLTYRFGVPGPDRPGSRAFERVRLYHPTTNGTLDLTVDPRRGVDADGFDNVARTGVNVTANDTAPVRVAGVDVAAITEDTATLSVRLSTDADVATGVPVTASAAGDPIARRTAVVPANDSRTVELNASTEASRLIVAVPGDEETVSLAAAPDVNGNGRAATDPDGDGLHEDVDGSGDFTIVDVAILLDRFDRPAVQDNPALFDFDGSGGVNVVDVAVLLEET